MARRQCRFIYAFAAIFMMKSRPRRLVSADADAMSGVADSATPFSMRNCGQHRHGRSAAERRRLRFGHELLRFRVAVTHGDAAGRLSRKMPRRQSMASERFQRPK